MRFDAPCSRIGHIYKGSVPASDDRKGVDFVTVNYKRVVEVWFESYKEIVYEREPEKFSKVEAGKHSNVTNSTRRFQEREFTFPGDLTYQFYVKERQHCKPFSYFLDFVAPDIVENFPLKDPPVFASGVIFSVAHPVLCFDTSNTLNRDSKEPIGKSRRTGS